MKVTTRRIPNKFKVRALVGLYFVWLGLVNSKYPSKMGSVGLKTSLVQILLQFVV